MVRTELNPVPDARFDREGDWEALQFFTESDRRLSPEEYAARHGHEWGSFSYHLYRYRDERLGAWVRRVGELLFNDEELNRLRHELLTAEERLKIERDAAAGF